MDEVKSTPQTGPVGLSRAVARYGFTLLELLVVMGIMVMLMSIATASFFGMRRGAEFRGAVSMVQNAMILARQQAVTKRRTVELTFEGGTNNSISMTEMDQGVQKPVHSRMVLPVGTQFDSDANTMAFSKTLTFSPVGSANSIGSVGQETVSVWERTIGKDGH
jgi:prepilin-type N-terminal cleavage/methylation domain-containing protein